MLLNGVLLPESPRMMEEQCSKHINLGRRRQGEDARAHAGIRFSWFLCQPLLSGSLFHPPTLKSADASGSSILTKEIIVLETTEV